jgi:hypothetical protein
MRKIHKKRVYLTILEDPYITYTLAGPKRDKIFNDVRKNILELNTCLGAKVDCLVFNYLGKSVWAIKEDNEYVPILENIFLEMKLKIVTREKGIMKDLSTFQAIQWTKTSK